MIRALALALLAATLSGCQPAPAPTTADAKIRADCRHEVDREYSAQNRADLTRRDDRDTAFSASYNSGVVSRGMGAQYQVDQMFSDCVRSSGDANASPNPGVAPAFSPAERGAGSSLRP